MIRPARHAAKRGFLSDALAAHIGKIKDSTAHRSDSAASAMASLGMLAASGLGAKRIVRVLPDLIRRVLPVDTVGFFWSNAAGEMTDAYVENPIFLSAEVLLSCQLYQQEDPRNWPSFTENVLAGPVAGYLLPFQTEAFYGSQHFAFTYERIGAPPPSRPPSSRRSSRPSCSSSSSRPLTMAHRSFSRQARTSRSNRATSSRAMPIWKNGCAHTDRRRHHRKGARHRQRHL